MLGEDFDFFGGQDESAYTDALDELLEIVKTTFYEVRTLREQLADEYPSEALSNISDRFERISEQYDDYITVRGRINFVVHKSNTRLKTTKKVAQSAAQTAIMFEKLAKNPNSYSRKRSRRSIKKLLGELKNLMGLCKAQN